MSRLENYLIEEEGDMDQVDIKAISDILHECSDMYNLYKSQKKFFYRGVDQEIDVWIKKTARSERKPRAMGLSVKDYLNDYFQKTFGWRARNGVFATSYIAHIIDNFDNPYIIFVPNGFKYVWSWEFMDLNLGDGDDWLDSISFKIKRGEQYHDDEWRDNEITIEKGFDSFTDKDIVSALKIGNEISFKCAHYYLVNGHTLTDTSIMNWIYNHG